jgi:hypothetical protein
MYLNTFVHHRSDIITAAARAVGITKMVTDLHHFCHPPHLQQSSVAKTSSTLFILQIRQFMMVGKWAARQQAAHFQLTY